MTTYPSGSLVGPGLYYDLDEGQFARLPSGGELPGSGNSLYVALPAWLAPPVLGLAAVAFRFLFPLVLLVVVSAGVVWRTLTGAVWVWRWSLHYVRLYPEPSLSYLTPHGRERRHQSRRAGKPNASETRRSDGLIDLQKEIARRRQRDS